MGAGLWLGFGACALFTVCLLMIVGLLALLAVGAIRGSKGIPGRRSVSALVAQLTRGPNGGYAAQGVPVYFQPASARQSRTGRYETGEFASRPRQAELTSTTLVGTVPGRLVATGDAPAIRTASPAESSVAIAVNAPVQVTFTMPMNRGSLTPETMVLRDPAGNALPTRISYNATNNTATIDPTAPLSYSTKYTVSVLGGAAGVKGIGGVGMVGDASWSFNTAATPQSGPGGPILVVTGAATGGFGNYYPEILRAEGLNAFATSDIGSVVAATLAKYRVVLLGQTALTSEQAGMFKDWVDGGGKLIAMRPDKQLAGVLGLTPTPTTLANSYLRVNTSSGPGVGITAKPMQFHGTADAYELNGATAVASLGGDAATVTKNPAVSIRNVGTHGGQAAAFTYDLATSVVYTRQGNPNWAKQDRDGRPPIRSDDLFYGNASFDPKPDWVDPMNVQIPQADEQQRLLANMITRMTQGQMPLPRFWYLPDGHKAVVIMTGDDHSSGGTAGRFDLYRDESDPNASVERWRTVRGTSYIYPRQPLTDSEAAEYVADGFEIALHLTTYEANWTPATLENFFATQLEEFEADYPSVPSPLTERTHAIVWSDFSTHAEVEFKHRIRLDTTYYYWPGAWVQNRPGLFTGSGFPMRFSTADGRLIDVYQAATQMTDESGQSYPYTSDALLDKALGPEGYYGMFTANMHTDEKYSPGTEAIIASARARNVPVITAVQAMRWLDGRNGSTFGGLSWNESARSLSFRVSTAPGANGLQGMLPLTGPGGATLNSIKRDGAALVYTVETIKGIAYAFFAAGTGNYVASYAGGDGTPPAVVMQMPEGGQSSGAAVGTATPIVTKGQPQ